MRNELLERYWEHVEAEAAYERQALKTGIPSCVLSDSLILLTVEDLRFLSAIGAVWER